METSVLVFPGQGSQRAGMAQDFCQEFAESRAVFDEASDALSLDLREICAGSDERLSLTEYTQPAILVAEIAMLRALSAHFGLSATHFGGHSLGEYTALVAAGAIPLAEAARLVRERGRRMQEAVPRGEGAMAAVMRDPLDPELLRATLVGLEVDLANMNAPDQIVISGSAADVAQGVARIQASPELHGARAKLLDVSAPFHSRLMAPIEAGFRALLQASSRTWAPARAAQVVSNYTGAFHLGESEAVVDALTRQISGGVRWVDDMRALLSLSPTRVLEIGPNRPLRGFFRALDVEVEAIFNTTTARRVLGG